MNARIALDEAMNEFVKAARAVGFEERSISGSILDSAFEAGIKKFYY